MKNKKVLFVIIGVVVAALAIVLLFVLKPGKETKPTIVQHTINYNTQGGNEISSTKVNDGSNIVLPEEPKKEGYIFTGWFINDEKITKEYTVKSDITLTAKWDEKLTDCMITFDSNGGSKVEAIQFNEESKIELPTPTRKGYKFVVWEDKNGMPILSGARLACEEIKLTAKWEKETVKQTETKPANKTVYTCPSGYTLKETKCTKIITKNATLSSESCPTGYNKNPSLGKCVANSYTSTATPTCPKGYTKRPGYSYCYQYVQSGLDQYTCETYTTTYVNGRYTNGSCYYGESVELTYKCPSGYHLQKIWGYAGPVDESYKCHELKDIIKKYSCESGYALSGTKCTKTETINATKK